MELNVLRELGEWAALGFYEGLDLPWPRAYGCAYRCLYENMNVTVPGHRFIIPHEPLENARTMASHQVWTATALICDFDHNAGLRVNDCVAEEKKERFPDRAVFIDRLVADLRSRLPHFGGYTHSNPDIRRIVSEGFDAIESELDGEIAALEAESGFAAAMPLMLALKDYARGVRSFHGRTAAALRRAAASATLGRKEKLERIADAFAGCFLKPATSFLEGFLAVNFAWMLDGCDSIGRVDQVLGALFERDIDCGTLDLGFARELLDEWWQNFERLNGWNLQIGGYTPDGRDGFNRFSMECLTACARKKLRRPNVALRITRFTPDEVLREALAVLRQGSGRPALYNDDLYVETLEQLDLGISAADAREVAFGGCTETMIGGLSNVGSLEGEINLAKALELALHDGFDPVARFQASPHTGTFQTMADFSALLRAVKRQIQHMTDAFVADRNAQLRRRFTEGDPKLYRTLFTRDCVRNRKSFEAGGARYNGSVVTYQGIANTVDSLAAIRKFVYEEQSIGRGELLEALAADYQGYERLRLKLSSAPRFGNDDDYADPIARDVVAYAWELLYAHKHPRGGRYLPSCILFATYGIAGKQVGATPDGRRAFEVLADSVGAAQGRDERGPTALLSSVAKLPLTLAIGTPVLNLRFQKKTMDSDAGLDKIASLVRGFFSKGGLQVQISVVSREDMMAAQRMPDKYRDLIVRIGGYSEYFTRLDRGLQESVIARTEHAL